MIVPSNTFPVVPNNEAIADPGTQVLSTNVEPAKGY